MPNYEYNNGHQYSNKYIVFRHFVYNLKLIHSNVPIATIIITQPVKAIGKAHNWAPNKIITRIANAATIPDRRVL
jgi:hypothetical protein